MCPAFASMTDTARHTVTFDGADWEGPDVYQDGVLVASISREPECFVTAREKAPEGYFKEAGFMARFKYARPMANAKRWCQFILERMTVAEYLTQLAEGKSPLAVATDLGYDSDPWL